MVQAASSAINKTGSYYQFQYKRLKERRGHKRAIVAIAHAMLVAIDHMIKNAEPYHERGANFLTQVDTTTKKNDAIKQLEKLGYSVSLIQQA